MNIKEAARELGVTVRTMREWIKVGKIKATKDKNSWFWVISEEEVERKKQERMRDEDKG